MLRTLLIGNARTLIAAIIGAVVMAASALYWHTSYADSATRAQLLQYGRFVAVQHETILQQSQHLISVLALLLAVTDREVDRCNLIMRLIAEQKARYIGGGVADIQGDVWCSSTSLEEKPISIADRSYFQQALATEKFTISNYLLGKATGIPTLVFAHPVYSDAELDGVITLALDLEWLHEFVDRSELPSGTTLTLVDNQGTILARHPDTAKKGIEAPEISRLLESVQSVNNGVLEVQVRDSEDRHYYQILTPLRISEQEGYLHLIISVPKDSITF